MKILDSSETLEIACRCSHVKLNRKGVEFRETQKIESEIRYQFLTELEKPYRLGLEETTRSCVCQRRLKQFLRVIELIFQLKSQGVNEREREGENLNLEQV